MCTFASVGRSGRRFRFVVARVAVLAIAVIVLLSPRTAVAQPVSWDGGGGSDTSWQNALNWNPNGVPTSTSDVTINSSFGGLLIPWSGTASANSVTLGTPPFNPLTLQGGTLTLTSGDLTRFDSIGNDDGVTIDSAVTIANDALWNVAGSGGVTVRGVLDESSGTRSFTKTGNGFLYVQQPAWAGPTTVSAGTLRRDRGTAGGIMTVLAGATLQVSESGGIAYPATTLSGTGVGGSGALRHLSGTSRVGQVTLAADGVRISADSGTLELPSGITDGASSFSWTKGGAGIVHVIGNSSYEGDTVIDEGTLVAVGNLLGSGTVIVNSGGTFATGLSFSNPISLAGTLAPGFSSGGVSSNITSNITLTANATFSCPEANESLTLFNAITDNGSGFGWTKTGPGLLSLLGPGTYQGNTVV